MGITESGKTTIAKTLFKHLPYVSLENIDTRFQAQNDPRAFLANYRQGAIFDEVQHVPELLSYFQEIVDESSVKGRYVLTGSQNFALSHHVSQSLSGRIGMTTLLPLSLSELGIPTNINSAIFKGLGYIALTYTHWISTPATFKPTLSEMFDNLKILKISVDSKPFSNCVQVE